MTNAKVRIDVPSGVVELEGDEGFVTTYLDKLLPFIEAGGFGTASAPERTPDPVGDSDDGGKSTKKRRTPKRPPSGQSCRDRIKILRDEGFFDAKRSGPEIVKGLEKKGWTHNNNQVQASLSSMFPAGEIQRMKDGGSFKYYYDRVK